MIFRGAVHEIKAAPGARDHEQQGRRFAVVVQSGLFEIDGKSSRILTDQIHSVAPERLGDFKGALDADQLVALDRALILKLGLF